MTTFADLGVPASMVTRLESLGIKSPFPIQEASIPDALAGRDILGRAPTGSGKTLAFGLPVLARVERAESGRPRALVLAPTRELADQIARELTPLAKTASRWVFAVYGGVGYELQRRQLRRGVDVLVATPGRLTDLIDQGSVSLADVDIVVIDEADRMADMGFMPQVRKLVDQTSSDRQTLLFSATLDGAVADLTRRYQMDPVRHSVEGDEDHGDAAHYFWRVNPQDRVRMTADIITSSTPSIVFTRTRRGAERVARQLGQAGVAAESIHGGRSQSQRTRALKAFSTGRVAALVATDVAARGIHVEGVASVIHFDLPDDPKDYLHRSGRTARAGAGGVVVSFMSAEQNRAVHNLQRSVGLDHVTHDPAADWLTGSSGSRLGTVASQEFRPAPTPSGSRNGSGNGNRSGDRNRNGSGNRNRNRNRNRSNSQRSR
ncbi:MAG TPA: DEAD/DEAH box helicase [Acidimicrobiia bacterium]|nr:DEAD/DEAH box helicase [Acidimicrobiia bacterium]